MTRRGRKVVAPSTVWVELVKKAGPAGPDGVAPPARDASPLTSLAAALLVLLAAAAGAEVVAADAGDGPHGLGLGEGFVQAWLWLNAAPLPLA